MDSATHYVGYQDGDNYWTTNLYANDTPETRIPRLAMVLGYIQAKLESEYIQVKLESDSDVRAIDYLDNLYDESGHLKVTIRNEMSNSVPAILFPAVMDAWEKVGQEERTSVSFNFNKPSE